MHQLLSGTLRHITAVNFAPRQYIVRHTTLCMRFSSSTSPFLMPHCAEVTAHAALFHTLSNIILGFCTHIRRTLLVISLLHSSPITLAPTTKQHQAIKFCLNRPYNRGTRGYLAWDLPIPDALSPYGEPQSYL